MGLASWSSSFSPCQFCSLQKCDLHAFNHAVGREELPWPLRTEDDYEASCLACERLVRIDTEEDRAAVISMLFWTKNGKHIGGRIVTKEGKISDVRLLPGDRVEPSCSLSDIGSIERARTPFVITFWRPRKSGRSIIDPVAHRNPLFCRALHSNPNRTLAIDSLHTIYYGPVQRWTCSAFWRLVLTNPWGCPGTADQQKEMGLRRLVADLKHWEVETAVPANRQVSQITWGMMGGSEDCSQHNWRHPGGGIES